jgi:NSS family neurotransmitter:Na+ symporter
LLAALSSAISLLEVPVGYVVQHYDYERSTIAVAMGVVVFLAGIPPAMGTGILGWYNDIVFEFLLPLVVLLLVIFVGWVAADLSADELAQGSSFGPSFTGAWLWWVRLVVPIAIVLTFLLGIQSLLLKAGVLAGPVFLG